MLAASLSIALLFACTNSRSSASVTFLPCGWFAVRISSKNLRETPAFRHGVLTATHPASILVDVESRRFYRTVAENLLQAGISRFVKETTLGRKVE